MQKEELLEFFVSLFPDFEIVWKSEDNLFREGRDYTFHGLCAKFGQYFQEDFCSFSEHQLTKLFRRIEEIIESDKNGKNNLSNAVCTCFLENLAQTETGNFTKKYLGKASKKYFDYWN